MDGVELLLRVSCLNAGCPSSCTTTGELDTYGDPFVQVNRMPEGWVPRKNPFGKLTGYWCQACASKRKIADGQARQT